MVLVHFLIKRFQLAQIAIPTNHRIFLWKNIFDGSCNFFDFLECLFQMIPGVRPDHSPPKVLKSYFNGLCGALMNALLGDLQISGGAPDSGF